MDSRPHLRVNRCGMYFTPGLPDREVRCGNQVKSDKSKEWKPLLSVHESDAAELSTWVENLTMNVGLT
jgi:hypothetical protein